MLCNKYIAFTRYPPRPDTSQDGGLVGLYESQKLCVLLLNILLVDYCTIMKMGVYALYSLWGL
jgi:hypothetical protein